MKTIGLDNYEIWVVDYFDGKLNAMQMETLRAFALAHPELAIELDESQWLALSEENLISFEHKSGLLKNEEALSARFNELCFKKIEGTNTDEEEHELSAMLLQNPVQAREWLIWLKTKLEVDVDVIYQFKEKLIKQFSETNSSDYQMWQVLEGDLNENDSAAFKKQWASNPLLKTHWLAFQQSFIEPDLSVVYPNKDELKKGAVIISMFWKITAAAASLALILGLYFTLQPDNNQSQLSQVNQSKNQSVQNNIVGSNEELVVENKSQNTEQETLNFKANIVLKMGDDFTSNQNITKNRQTEFKSTFQTEKTQQLDEMELMAANEIDQFALPQLVMPAPVSIVDWATAMALEESDGKNAGNRNGIWALVRRQVNKRIDTESIKLSIDKKELTQSADYALQRISKGTLKINTENGRNSIALNRDAFKLDKNN